MQSLNLNSEVDFRLCGRHLEKSIWRHNSAADRRITAKLGTLVKNDMPMTKHWPKSKLAVEFQHGSRPFYETGSSFFQPWTEISNRNLVRKVDFHLPKRVPWLKTEPGSRFLTLWPPSLITLAEVCALREYSCYAAGLLRLCVYLSAHKLERKHSICWQLC